MGDEWGLLFKAAQGCFLKVSRFDVLISSICMTGNLEFVSEVGGFYGSLQATFFGIEPRSSVFHTVFLGYVHITRLN